MSEIYSFLSLVVYYQIFIEKFFKLATPLTHLTQKRVKLEWSEECEKNFEELKRRLISAPILTIPSESRGFIIHNDASKKDLGCVLIQYDKVIAYAFRKLRPYE